MGRVERAYHPRVRRLLIVTIVLGAAPAVPSAASALTCATDALDIG
jgi:hypothetical protein